MNDEKNRFYFLDAVRGLAAIAVMIYHYSQHNGLHWLKGAWVAVDLFFILSGFVIAHSYGAKIVAGMSFRYFMGLRLIRLMPLYFSGLILGLISYLLLIVNDSLVGVDGFKIFVAAILSAFVVPYVNNYSWPFGTDLIVGAAFPLNDPAWSLFFELIINIFFFFYVQRFLIYSNIKFVVLALVLFVASSLFFQVINPGWGGGTILLGFPRVTFGFFAGTLIYQARISNDRLRPLLTVFLGAAVIFIVSGCGGGKVAFVGSISLIPLFFIMACSVKLNSLWAIRISKLLGNISYPLYIIHFPLYRIFSQISAIKECDPILQEAFVCLIALASAYCFYLLDARFRKFIDARVSTCPDTAKFSR